MRAIYQFEERTIGHGARHVAQLRQAMQAQLADAREVALGIDYWIEPSIVWQTEFDIELPRAEGTLFSFNGSSTPAASSIGAPGP